MKSDNNKPLSETEKYLKDPNLNNFNLLADTLNNSSLLVQIMYEIFYKNVDQVRLLKHLIISLYRNERFIELLYYRNLYNSKSEIDIDIEKLIAISFIECGWLIQEDELLENCMKLDVEEFNILYLRLIYNLRSGNLLRAYNFAKAILVRNVFLELELNAIIELSIRLKDGKMISDVLNSASKRNIKIKIGKDREAYISKILKKHLIIILNKIKKENE